jgi:hypothetical protein
MFWAFLAHHQEILCCLVSRYGKRKCGRELWCPVVSLALSVFPWHCLSVNNSLSDIKLDTHTHTHTHIYIYIYIKFYDARNLEPKKCVKGFYYFFYEK